MQECNGGDRGAVVVPAPSLPAVSAVLIMRPQLTEEAARFVTLVPPNPSRDIPDPPPRAGC